MQIREFQELMDQLYGSKDRQRGLEKTFLWFIEEIGELSEAIRMNSDRTNFENLKDECADVFAWFTSLCNILGVDLEDVVGKKYPGHCPKCRENPCKCKN